MNDIGATVLSNGDVRFRVWAPKAQTVSVAIQGASEVPMQPTDKGFFECTVSSLQSPVDYLYRIDGKKKFSDPASRWQPQGVHGPSRVYDPRGFTWNDLSWKGIPVEEYVIYELHVGCFTPEGTFEAVINKLPYLHALGVTAIELMPVVEFPGGRNWGYDGAYPYAPHHLYGGPTALKRLIDACHREGLAVILDVVYNHLGPEGNYLDNFGYYFTDRYKTPWGTAINYDGLWSDQTREYFIENALYWLTEYHVDALRIDAVHAIYDFSAQHILKELRAAFHSRAKSLGRQAFIIAESDLNDIRIISPLEKGGYAVDAQWNDDFHHALHTVLTKSQWGYFEDFGTLAQLVKAIIEGFVYSGEWSGYRQKKFGSSSASLPGNRFVIFIQNHDQIGNASQGKRLGTLLNQEQYKLAMTILFCSPGLPLLFMGQEWNATTPFYFFTSFQDEGVIKGVREGYCREFRLDNHGDPQSPERFNQSKIRWDELEQANHQQMRDFTQQLIRLRKELTCLSNGRKDLIEMIFNEDEEWLILMRGDPDGSQIILVANLASERRKVPVPFPRGLWMLALPSSDPQQLEVSEPTIQFNDMPAWTFRLWIKKHLFVG